MAKRSGTATSNRTEFAAYFNPATRVPEPPLQEVDRKRYDDLGVIGAQELTTKGYYAGFFRGTPSARAKAAAETTVLLVDDDAGIVEAGIVSKGGGDRRIVRKPLHRQYRCRERRRGS